MLYAANEHRALMIEMGGGPVPDNLMNSALKLAHEHVSRGGGGGALSPISWTVVSPCIPTKYSSTLLEIFETWRVLRYIGRDTNMRIRNAGLQHLGSFDLL